MDPIFGGVAIQDRMFTSIISPRTANNFAVISAHGKPLNRFTHPLNSRFNHIIMDNRVTMTRWNNTIAALQMYDSMLLLFDEQGRLKSRTKLAGNPLDWEVYQELDYVFSFLSLVMTDQWILAFFAARGGIGVNQYSHDGKWIGRYTIPFDSQETFSLARAVALDHGPTPDLMLLINQPIPQLARVSWGPKP